MLPSYLHPWLETDPLTHKFHLYFMCDVGRSHGNQHGDHVHISDHLGYNLIRPDWLYQSIVRFLTMVKQEFPQSPHPTKILLWKHSRFAGVTTFRALEAFSPENIEILVDRTIPYLQGLLVPRYGHASLHPSDSRDIQQYLNVHDGDNTFGNLFRYIDRDGVTCRRCEYHILQKDNLESLDQLRIMTANMAGISTCSREQSWSTLHQSSD